MIPTFELTLSNYRCFHEDHPAKVIFSDDAVALTGQNNSGKSALLIFFLEFKELWSYLGHKENRSFKVSGEAPHIIHVINMQGIEDRKEIFSNKTENPLTVTIKVPYESYPNRSNYHGALLECVIKFNQSSKNASIWFRTSTDMSILTRGMAGNNWQWNSDDTFQFNNIRIDCSVLFEVVRALENIIYVPAVRNAANAGAADLYGFPIGTNFIEIWDAWKQGGTKEQSKAIINVQEDIKHLFGFKQLEINATPNKKSLQLIINGESYRLREIGSGISQFIITLANVAIKKPDIIFIDEPELNLHPSLQVDFLMRLIKYSKYGVVYATHSLGLARSTSQRIYSFRQLEGQTIVTDYMDNSNPSYAEFIGAMGYSGYAALGFTKILLVEGTSDVKVFNVLLGKLQLDHKVVIIPMGGTSLAKGGVEHELNEIQRLSPSNIFAIADSEAESEASGPIKARVEFLASCKKLKIHALLTRLRSIENYFSDASIKAVLGHSYGAIGPYDKANWDKNNNWRMAQYTSWAEIKGTDVGQFLLSMK